MKKLLLTLFIFKGLIPITFGQTFQKFNELVSEENNIVSLQKIRAEEYNKFIESKNYYFLYNSKYVEFFIKSKSGDVNELIQTLSWVIEDGKQTDHDQLGWFNYHMGSNLSVAQAERIALDYAKKALDYGKKAKDSTLTQFASNLIGSIYFKLSVYEEAKKFYQNAYDLFPSKDFFDRGSMLNNIGLCEMRLGKNNEALTNFQNSIEVLDKIANPKERDKNFKAIVKGNKGSALHRLGDFNSAIKLLEEEVEYDLQSTDPTLRPLAEAPLIELLNIYITKDLPSDIANTIKRMHDLEKSIAGRNGYPLITEELYRYYSKFGNNELALKQGEKLYNLLIAYSKKNSERTAELNEIIYQDKLKHFKKDKIAQDVSLEKARNEKKSFQIISIISFILGILAIITVSIFFINKRKNLEKDLYIQEQYKQLEVKKNIILENENKIQQEKITNLAINLRLKKETEKAFLTKINELKRKKNVDPEVLLKDLQISVTNLMNIDKKISLNSLETDDVLEKFKFRLASLHPTLSKSDMEYCCYFRLNMSAKEIGAIHGQSDGSIRVLKNKIKNKLELTPEKSLTEYLMDLG